MEKLRTFNRKFLSFVLCLAMLASLYTGGSVISDAAVPTVTVISGSDYQPSSSTQPFNYCSDVMKGLKNAGVDPYGVLMCGDYSGGFSTTASEEGIADIKSLISENFGTVNQMIFSQGNHDPAATKGLTPSGAHDTQYYGVYVLNDDDYGWFNGDSTSMEGMDGHVSTIKREAEEMRSYFAQKASEGYDKPIFITAHIPLHNSFRTRTYKDGQYALYFVDVLNEAGAAGLNIIYLYGHNHSGPSDDYIGGGSVYLSRGDTMFVSQLGNVAATPVQVPLNFTYMNAGYVGYCANSNPGGNVLNMAVFEITGDQVVVKRCGANGFVNVGAQCSWWSSVENASTYGTTDAYLKPATGKTENLSANYNGWNMVNTYKYSTEYVLVPSLSSGGTYVIADGNKTGSALAVQYATGDTGTKNVTVNEGEGIVTLSGVSSDIEWVWTLIEGSYGTFKGSGGRYLQIENQTNGTLRTSSDYLQTENGIRYSMWRMSSSASNGMYAYVYGESYSGTDGRSYLRSNGTSFVSRNYGDLALTSTKPVYVYQKTNLPITTTYWVKVEGVTDYSDKPLYYTSWDDIETIIRSKLVVTVKDSTGTHTTTDYTLGDVTLSEKGYTIVPVMYKNEAVGGVTVYVDNDASLDMLKKLTYNEDYYVNNYGDLKAAFGEKPEELWPHFITFGVKEGRRANSIFDLKYYVANNNHVKEMFGNNYLAAMEYYINIGYKEPCYTAQACDLGDSFYAKIGTALGCDTMLSFNESNVEMITNQTIAEQEWQFLRQSDGTYEIINRKNGLALTVTGNKIESGTNVILAENTHMNGQRWFIYQDGDYYTLRPLCSAECVLDIFGAITTSGANVHIYTTNRTNAQKFTIEMSEYVDFDKPENIGSDFVGSINIKQSGVSVATSGVNTELVTTDEDSTAQKYFFIHQADGSYKIVNVRSRYVLGTDIAEAGANVVISVENSEMEVASWFIYNKNGKYILEAAGTEKLVLTVKDGQLNVGANIELAAYENGAGQTFEIINYGAADYDIPEETQSGVLTTEQVASVNEILCTVDSSLIGQNIDDTIAQYAKFAFDAGVTEVKSIMMCVNIGFIGGESEIMRIVTKTDGDCSVDNIYSSLLTDMGSQAGTCRRRNFNVYCAIVKL